MSLLNRTFQISAIVTFALMVAVPASAREDSPSDSSRPCLVNATHRGSRLSGRVFTTWQQLDGVTYDSVFRRIGQMLVKHAWGNVVTNKDLGTISAGDNASKLNFTINESKGGVRVDARLDLSDAMELISFTAKKAEATLCVFTEAGANQAQPAG